VGGAFVLLRDTVDALVYLGCMMDAGGYVHDWLELWVQNIAGIEQSIAGNRDNISNQSLDARWSNRARIMADADRQSIFQTGAETSHPLPTFFNLALTGAVHPASDGKRWEICCDDQLLQKNELPPYSTSLARYLYLPDAEEARFLSPAAAEAPGKAVRTAKEELGPLIPFNADGSLMLARRLAPLSLDEYATILSGGSWPGLGPGSKVFKLDGVYRTLQNASQVQNGEEHFFLSRSGRFGRLLEVFHLKLDLIAQTVALVRNFTNAEQLPFLNLSSESFRITLGDSSDNLPALWTARVSLASPGAAFALPLETSEARYFMAPGVVGPSIFRSMASGMPLAGTAAVRIRKVVSQDDGNVVIEGTLLSQERFTSFRNDLIWVRLALPAGRVDLCGNLTEGMAQGERRFRTLPQKFSESRSMALRATEGVRFANAPFETLPLLTSPFDLYSLGVVALQTLLVSSSNTLAIALDEILSLAQAAAELGTRENTDLFTRILSITSTDPRWLASLGPHRLLADDSIGGEKAVACVSPELWWKTIATIIRLFPGSVGKESFCTDLTDAPPFSLGSIYDQPIAVINDLLRQSRALLFSDWKFNSEVSSILRDLRKKHIASTNPG
jgi:hypothetical protein